MNKRQSPANGDSAVILFGPGDYCALTLFRLNARYKAVHAAGALLPHFLGHMGVGVQRECRCVVAQILLHGLYIVTRSECGNCIAVPEIMKAGSRYASSGGQLLEMQIDSLSAEVLSESVGKYKVKWVAPRRASHQPLFILHFALVGQDLHDVVRR